VDTTPIPPSNGNGGRVAAKLTVSLRADIAAGRLVGGQFLPTERQLAEDYGIARMTVRRALKSLEAAGLVAAEPRHGYRVLARGNDPGRGCPLAYVLEAAEQPDAWDDTHKTLLACFQVAAANRGCSLLSLSSKGLSPDQLLEQLLAGRAWGAALDTVNSELLSLARKNGFPAVMVDAWTADAPIDSVLQDDYQGGFLAASHLAGRGHRRIGWLGPVTSSAHSLGRYAGAMAGLARVGLAIPAKLRVAAQDADASVRARSLLARRDRPTAVLALWSRMSQAVAGAARELGLVLGKNLDIVGWSIEELYESAFRPGFPGGRPPPAIVWSASAMAQTTVNRLAERRANPNLPAMKLSVPVRLRLPDQ